MARESQATTLVKLAMGAGIELFHTPSHDAYVLLPVETHRECWPVRSTACRRWLSRMFFLSEETTPRKTGNHRCAPSARRRCAP